MKQDRLFTIVFTSSQVTLIMTLVIAVLTALSLREAGKPDTVPSATTHYYGDDTTNVVPGSCGPLETGEFFITQADGGAYTSMTVTTIVSNQTILPDWVGLANFALQNGAPSPGSFLGGALSCTGCNATSCESAFTCNA
jgi:hypothetical protein